MILYARYFRRSYFGYAVFAKGSPFDFARPFVLGLSLVVEISPFWFSPLCSRAMSFLRSPVRFAGTLAVVAVCV
jgi:hypothetical protein